MRCALLTFPVGCQLRPAARFGSKWARGEFMADPIDRDSSTQRENESETTEAEIDRNLIDTFYRSGADAEVGTFFCVTGQARVEAA